MTVGNATSTGAPRILRSRTRLYCRSPPLSKTDRGQPARDRTKRTKASRPAAGRRESAQLKLKLEIEPSGRFLHARKETMARPRRVERVDHDAGALGVVVDIGEQFASGLAFERKGAVPVREDRP